jgi:hypothetical protein
VSAIDAIDALSGSIHGHGPSTSTPPPPGTGGAPAPDQAAPPRRVPPPPPPPELALARRIAETMALVKLDCSAETELARWPITCERRGGQRAVLIHKDATVIDIEHPLAKAALVDDGDHAPFFMLCAVVYGAVTARLGAVTDDHERAFLGRLIDHARSAVRA